MAPAGWTDALKSSRPKWLWLLIEFRMGFATVSDQLLIKTIGALMEMSA
jgi:hypothetical protein